MAAAPAAPTVLPMPDHPRAAAVLSTALLAAAALPALLVPTAPLATADQAWPSSLTLSRTLRDFEYAGAPVHSTATNPDFQRYENGLEQGLVLPAIGPDGTPQLATTGTPVQVTSAASFAQWFHDVPGTNVKVSAPLTLGAIGPGVYQYSSNRYYPLDGQGWNDPSYGPNPQTDHDCNDSLPHNFSFTQEIHARLVYRAGTVPTIDVRGDDDIWAFIDGHLVIDLGGVHPASDGSVTLDAATLATLGISAGQTYAFDLFTAERHTCASDFRLTISGAAPPAPEMAVGGVADGARYEYGQVPPATCALSGVVDPPGVDPVLSTPTGGNGTGQQTATCSYTDTSGQTATASATYTVVDTTPPVVTVTAPASVEATGPTTHVPVTASATDVVDGALQPACVVDGGALLPSDGMDLPVGPHTIACSAKDSSGNTGTASTPVTVVDTTPPTLPPLADVTVSAGPDGTASAAYPPPGAASDLVDGTDPVSCTPVSGSRTLTSGSPSTTVTCTAHDSAGNTAAGEFTVTADETARDTSAPVITVPGPFTVEATGPDGATVPYPAPTAVDAVDGPLPVRCDHAPDSEFPLGATTVTCTSTDAAGNSAQTAFVVTVADTTAPRVTTPGARTAVASSLSGARVGFAPPTASDAVDGTDPVVCTMPSRSLFPLGVTSVSCTSTDAAGNQATASFPVTVGFGFGGFLPPLRADGTSAFGIGTTVPIRFVLTGASRAVTDAPARLCLVRLSRTPARCDTAHEAAFRYVHGRYEQDLATRRMAAGTWVIVLDLGDGARHLVRFRLR